MKHVIIYTDGGALGNPGPGGWAAVLSYKDTRRELSGGFRNTTNNRMELLAVIKALEKLKYPCRATVYSDSRYLVDGVNRGWARRWRAKGWMRTKTDPAKNADLWARLLDQCARHEVEMKWVKGHAGIAGNERCDALVRQVSARKDLPPDKNYESGNMQPAS